MNDIKSFLKELFENLACFDIGLDYDATNDTIEISITDDSLDNEDLVQITTPFDNYNSKDGKKVFGKPYIRRIMISEDNKNFRIYIGIPLNPKY